MGTQMEGAQGGDPKFSPANTNHCLAPGGWRGYLTNFLVTLCDCAKPTKHYKTGGELSEEKKCFKKPPNPGTCPVGVRAFSVTAVFLVYVPTLWLNHLSLGEEANHKGFRKYRGVRVFWSPSKSKMGP